jgi:uncharacterized OsmC-like protein
MTTVTTHAGPSGAVREVVFGSSGSSAEGLETHGDAGAGPSPYDYLLVALGA